MIYDFKIVNRQSSIVNRQLSIVNYQFLIGKRSREPRRAFPLRETFPRAAAGFPTSGNAPASRGGFSHFGKRSREPRQAFPLRETAPRFRAELSQPANPV